MLTLTSELAVKALVYLALHRGAGPIPPAEIADRMAASPSYLKKVMTQLAKGGLVRAYKGPNGGMLLARAPEEITLCDIVEACQGLLIANYCRTLGGEITEGPVCAYHRAMWEVRQATLEALTRWRLSDLVACPLPGSDLPGKEECRMWFLADMALPGPAGS